MITANFRSYANYITDSLYQWDKNQTLVIEGLNLSTAPEVHFSNADMDRAIVRQAKIENYKVVVEIPNSMLQSDLRIYAHIGFYEGETFKTVEVVEIPVIPRKKPYDYALESADEEIYSFNALQNRIDNIIANSTETGTNTELVDIRTGQNGKVYASAGAAVRTQFEFALKGSGKFIGQTQGDFPYNSVDDFPVNTIYTNGYNISGWMQNLPADDFIGVIVTMSHANTASGGGVVQVAYRNTGAAMYTRVKWSKWSAWKETLLGDIAITGADAIIPTGTHITSAETGAYTSCNDFPINSIVTLSVPIEDCPTETAYGTVLTYNFTADNAAGAVQLFFNRVDRALYTRSCWGNAYTWDEWRKCLQPGDIAEIKSTVDSLAAEAAPLVASFLKIGCVGDSLASGEAVYKDADGGTAYADLYDHSWPQFLAKKYGIECVNLSAGGLSTRTWLTHSRGWTMAQENVCNGYIIGLGQNDIALGADYLGTAADIDTADYNNNADSYYGNYGKIISLLKTLQPKAKIFLLTDPIVTDFNAAIREVAGIFENCYVIDLEELTGLYTGEYLSGNKRGGHYNSVAYNYMAQIIGGQISKYMYDNPAEFEQVEFIGTEYAY